MGDRDWPSWATTDGTGLIKAYPVEPVGVRMRYLSVCSGIESASVAWRPLGFEAAAFSEIDRFPRAVLEHRFPHVPLHGDFTTIEESDYGPIDILVGGTPCQSFSVAGLRGGMADDRGNLALEFCRLAIRKRPRWIVWENVPGVLSSNEGRDFGAFLGALAECGYGFAYRVLDAQYVRVQSHAFAVPQRRRRVFVVGYLGDWRRAAQVLFERESLCGYPPPRREAGQGVASVLTSGAANGSREHGGGQVAVAFTIHGTDKTAKVASQTDVAGSIRTKPPGSIENSSTTVALQRHATEYGVRRLTPLECERLMGFPARYTDVPYRGKPAADGPRYKALGNSMAVNAMSWLGQRIKHVEDVRCDT